MFIERPCTHLSGVFFQAQLSEEINRLREIKKLMDDAKADGTQELPEWVSESRQLRTLFENAEKNMQNSQGDQTSHQKKFSSLMKTDPKEAERLDFKYVNCCYYLDISS